MNKKILIEKLKLDIRDLENIYQRGAVYVT